MLEIRPAKPTDTGAVALIYSAAPEYFECVFTQGKKTAKDFIAYSMADGRGFMGSAAQHVATFDGEVVGNVSLYSHDEYKRLSAQTAKLIKQFYGWRMLPMLRGLLLSQRWMEVPGADTEYVANLGVSPTVQGQGIGTKLLEYGLDHARKRGKAHYALDVAVNNPNAERLYRRFGMSQQWQRDFHKSGKVPATRRLAMPT